MEWTEKQALKLLSEYNNSFDSLVNGLYYKYSKLQLGSDPNKRDKGMKVGVEEVEKDI